MNLLKKIINNLFNRKKTKMEQEILEQPDIIFELIRKYINKDYTINIELPDNIKNISLIASGSSYHSAAITANFIRNNLNLSSQAYYASEVSISENFNVNDNTLYIFISQSGETADTNSSLDRVRQKTKNTLAITNEKNSKLWNNSTYKICTFAGAEKAIASTKAMCAQLFCLLLVAIKIMQSDNIPSIKYLDELLNVPEYIKNSFNKREEIKKYSKILYNYENAVVLASGLFYPLAKEGALKIKETSFINTTAYPTGEFLHGHIAILNKKCAVILLVNNQNIQFIIDVLLKMNKNYKTDTVIISALPINDSDNGNFIKIDSRSDIDFLFSSLAIMQLLAFETAVLLNRNVDSPQGLTKVVK